MADLTAALIGRYTVERELGRGGMATVHLAKDVRHDRLVALKVLHPDLLASLGAERFLREVKITARLNHPHILPLLDSGEADGCVFYVMPYVAGETLRARLSRERQLPVDDAIRIAGDAADALAYAHAQGIVHRDIKPENILLASDHAVVADFGIAKAVSDAVANPLTATGVIIGTPVYMSPEQAGGGEDIDGRSDIYSLACVLYEMLAGVPPFGAVSVAGLVQQHLSATPPAVTTIRPSVPAAVADAIQRALAKTPADRFADATQFRRALTDAMTGVAPTAPAPGTSRRVPRAAIVAVVALAATLAIAFVATRNRGRAPSPTASVSQRTALAVLPFQNLSAQGPHAYFSSGLHDELLMQLSRVAALRVTSRTSVMAYAGPNVPSARQIARDLAVGSIVEGTVQVVGERLRVSVQLIDVATDAPLWSERYDRTLDDAFAIQSDIAQRIVTAVGAALSGVEAQRLAEAPTANAEAYRLYLQGREHFLRPARLRQDYETAQQFYERARDLDSTFALARAALAEVHSLIYLLRYDPTPERLTHIIAEADAAIRLAPEHPRALEARGIALGQGRGDYGAAIQALEAAARANPNDARLWQRIGFVRRRLGRWEPAMAAFVKSTEVDPRDADLFLHRGFTEGLLRRYDDALRSYERAVLLAPDFHAAVVAKGTGYARWRGQLDTLDAALRRLPRGASLATVGDVPAHAALLAYWKRQPDSLLRVVQSAGARVFEWELSYFPVSLYSAWAHAQRGRPAGARASLDSARAVVNARLARFPNDWRAVASRGLVMASLGIRDSALAMVRQLELADDYPGGYFSARMAEDRARILARLGDADPALGILEELLRRPSWVTRHTLRLDPDWDRIREHPRFKVLLLPVNEP